MSSALAFCSAIMPLLLLHCVEGRSFPDTSIYITKMFSRYFGEQLPDNFVEQFVVGWQLHSVWIWRNYHETGKSNSNRIFFCDLPIRCWIRYIDIAIDIQDSQVESKYLQPSVIYVREFLCSFRT